MVDKGGLLQTQNYLDPDPPGGGIYCCRYEDHEIEHCYTHKVPVFKRYGETQMTSPAGSVRHREYTAGACVLEDKTTIIWKPNSDEHCEFLPWSVLKGSVYGNHFVADSQTLALTWDKSLEASLKDCNGKSLTMSHQGIPFRILRIEPPSNGHRNVKTTFWKFMPSKRVKRQNDVSEHRIVTTDQLAATVQALSERISYALKSSFRHAMTSTCQSMEQVYTVLRDLIFAAPTRTARTFLNTQELIS